MQWVKANLSLWLVEKVPVGQRNERTLFNLYQSHPLRCRAPDGTRRRSRTPSFLDTLPGMLPGPPRRNASISYPYAVAPAHRYGSGSFRTLASILLFVVHHAWRPQENSLHRLDIRHRYDTSPGIDCNDRLYGKIAGSRTLKGKAGEPCLGDR